MLIALACITGFLVGTLVCSTDTGTHRSVRNYWRQGGDK